MTWRDPVPQPVPPVVVGPYYEHYHFVPVKNRERRLLLKVSTAAKALGERWNLRTK